MFEYSKATALVTGATSGIGEAIARNLAARGVPTLILVARDEDRLREIAGDLTDGENAPRVETVAMDLAEEGAADRVKAATDGMGLAVDLLVNDAGVWATGPFEAPNLNPAAIESGGASTKAMVHLNVGALVALTEAYLPAMVERAWGGVVNIGSTAAFQPFPYSAVYGATKAFVLSFSQALWAELNDRGYEDVRVVCVCPGITATDAAIERGTVRDPLAKVGVGTPEEVAIAVAEALEGESPVRIVGRANTVTSMISKTLPKPLVASAVARARRAYALGDGPVEGRAYPTIPKSLLTSALPFAATVCGLLLFRAALLAGAHEAGRREERGRWTS